MTESYVAPMPSGLGIGHHFSDGLYAKEIHIPASHFIVGHRHEYSHLSILAQGEVDVVTRHDGEARHRRYTAPACIDIPAGVHHEIRALRDSVWFCVHATDEKDLNKVDETLIQK